jgi:hypothetical protein
VWPGAGSNRRPSDFQLEQKLLSQEIQRNACQDLLSQEIQRNAVSGSSLTGNLEPG